MHKEIDFAPHPVVGLVLPVGDAEKFQPFNYINFFEVSGFI